MLLTTTLVWILAAPPAPIKVAVAPFAGGEGTTPAVLGSVAEMLASALRKTPQWQVLTYGELQAVLSHEQLKELIGCSDAKCYADLGNAAGIARLATGSLGKVGASWLLSLKLIDSQSVTVVATADRRIKGSIDDVLDALPIAANELVEQASKVANAPAVTPTAAPAPAPAGGAAELPKGFADEPFADQALVASLRWLEDAKGRLLAFQPGTGASREIFAGDARGVYRQRILGGGAEGDIAWSATFWEPRVSERWQAEVAFKEQKYAVRCGTSETPYQEVPAKKAAALAKKVPVFDVRWQRQAVLIGRDDEGTYYYVDQARERRAASHEPDYRLFVGKKPRLRRLSLDDAVHDGAGLVLFSPEGRLVARELGADVPKLAWAIGKSEQPLTAMDLFRQAKAIYTDLGVYGGQPLGTPCDQELGR